VLLLALDTSGTGVGVAVHDGVSVLAEVAVAGARKHAEQLMPAVVTALAQAGVDRSQLTDLVVGVGPGPFTGLRVGLVTAQVVSATLGLPLHGVCSLDAIAEALVATEGVVAEAVAAAGHRERFLVATDARRREVYWAGYEVTDGPWPWRRLDGPHVSAPVDVPVTVDGVRRVVLGPGAMQYPDVLGPIMDAAGVGVHVGALATIAARALLAGEGVAEGRLVEPQPWYLRRPDAVPSSTRKRVLQ
jgi:tRNA threonylcarbamoyladenosine biosynthesis protein TsaB